MTRKEDLREQLKILRGGLLKKYRNKFTEDIERNVLSYLDKIKFKNVLVYLSFGSEVSTQKIIEGLLERGKSVYVPKTIGDNMFAAVYGGETQKSKFGVDEPIDDTFCDDIEISLTPLLGVDKAGNRIGYGKGYYDKFFNLHKDVFKIGVCFDFQVVDSIPSDENDIKLDMVITEEGIIKF